MLAGFMAMSAMENQKELLGLVDQISLDGKGGSAVQTEARKAATARVERMAREQAHPEEIPDAPEMVIAGEVPPPALAEGEQAGGLSGPGSYEAAMRMFGPPQRGGPNPHGTHEVTEEG